MIRKLISKRGETLAEVLLSVVITMLALLMLSATLCVFALPQDDKVSEPSSGVVSMTLVLGYSSIEADIDVIYNEEGYSYEPY